MSLTPKQNPNTKEKLSLSRAEMHLDRRTAAQRDNSGFNLCLNFIGIVKIAWELSAKGECWKSSKKLVSLRMSQNTPKRRSPNPYKYKLKWAGTVSRLQMQSKM